jgi:hypothetical protein
MPAANSHAHLALIRGRFTFADPTPPRCTPTFTPPLLCDFAIMPARRLRSIA